MKDGRHYINLDSTVVVFVQFRASAAMVTRLARSIHRAHRVQTHIGARCEIEKRTRPRGHVGRYCVTDKSDLVTCKQCRRKSTAAPPSAPVFVELPHDMPKGRQVHRMVWDGVSSRCGVESRARPPQRYYITNLDHLVTCSTCRDSMRQELHS